jgi:hypothetical protein
MKKLDSEVECRCPSCKKHFRRSIDPKEPPPRKGDYYLVFCDQCRQGSLYPSERQPAGDD